MRLFIAIDVPDCIKEHLVCLQEHFSSFTGMRFVRQEAIHLTLKFLGDSDSETLFNPLSRVSFSPFELRLARLGLFGDRIFWAGFEHSSELLKLKRSIDAVLPGFEDEKVYKPHLTLARMSLKDKEAFARALESMRLKPLRFQVSEFRLYQSILGPEGAKYSILKSFRA